MSGTSPVPLEVMIEYAKLMRDLCGVVAVAPKADTLQELKGQCHRAGNQMDEQHFLSVLEQLRMLEEKITWRYYEDPSRGIYQISLGEHELPMNLKYDSWRIGEFITERGDRRRLQANLRRVVPELDLKAHFAAVEREIRASNTIGSRAPIYADHTVQEVFNDRERKLEWDMIEHLWVSLVGNVDHELKGVFAYLPPPLKLSSGQRLEVFMKRLNEMYGCFVVTKPIVPKSKVKQKLVVCKLGPNSCRANSMPPDPNCKPTGPEQARDSIYSVVALAQNDTAIMDELNRRAPGRSHWGYQHALEVLHTDAGIRERVGRVAPCDLPSQWGREEDKYARRCNPNAVIIEQAWASPLALAPNQCYHAASVPRDITAARFMADICVSYGVGLSRDDMQPVPEDALPDEVPPEGGDDDDNTDDDNTNGDDDDHQNSSSALQTYGIPAGVVLAAIIGTVAIGRVVNK